MSAGPPQLPPEGYEYRQEPYAAACPVCNGAGWVTPGQLRDCPQCSGTGRVSATRWKVVKAGTATASTCLVALTVATCAVAALGAIGLGEDLRHFLRFLRGPKDTI